MESTMKSLPCRKKRSHRRSRSGCRNCKLRRVKCDEAKPQCMKCRNYGVSCNFTFGVPDLQVLETVNFQSQNAVCENRLALAAALPTPLNPHIICSDGITSFVMDARCLAALERFRLATLSPFSPEMTKIWQHRVPRLAFQNPYLMHTILAMAAAHERHQSTTINSKRNQLEVYHRSQGVLIFNQKLYQPIEMPDRDPLWATAALVGMLTLASFDDCSPEEAWPLRQPHASDLDWFRISDGKRAVWELTNPLRPGGIFATMTHEYAQLNLSLPTAGSEGLPLSLAEVCNIDDSSNKENNPYFVSVHVLVQMMVLLDSKINIAGIRMVSFLSHIAPEFKDLLSAKDPVALLLLALWYERAGPLLWWVERRAHVEMRSIRLYLEKFHGGERKIHRLLPSPAITI